MDTGLGLVVLQFRLTTSVVLLFRARLARVLLFLKIGGGVFDLAASDTGFFCILILILIVVDS